MSKRVKRAAHKHCKHSSINHEEMGWTCPLWPRGGECCIQRVKSVIGPPIKWPKRGLSAKEILKAIKATPADIKAVKQVLIDCGLIPKK